MAKQRTIPEHELPVNHEQWWAEQAVTGARAGRHESKRQKKQAGRMALLMLLGVVLLVLAATLIFLDFRRGMTAGDPNPTPVSRTGVKTDRNLLSPDTIKRKLERVGYEVDPLVDTYDRTKHGYDVAETKIDGKKATILAFPDKAVARDFVNVAGNTGYVVVWKDLWAISFGQRPPLEAKQLAEEVAGKLDARVFWTPEGE